MATDETKVPEDYDTGEYDLEDDASTEEDTKEDSPDETEWDRDRAKKAMSKKNQENQALRTRLKALEKYEEAARAEEEKNKTSEEKYAEVVQTKAALERDLWRTKVAWEKGLTPSQAKRLVGDTLEALQADAEELLTDLGGSSSTTAIPVPARRAREVHGAPQGEETAPKIDTKNLADEIWAKRGTH